MDSNADEDVARRLLADLQEAITAADLDRVLQVFDRDVVVFGTAAANLDREQSIDYLERVVGQPATIRWDWDRVLPLARDGSLLAFAAVGTVGFDGDPDEERHPFRLTCVAVRDGSRWRLRHFHGSVPQS